MYHQLAKQQGITIIEVMVVLIIISVITAGAAMNFMGKADDAKVKQVRTDMATIEKALDMYKLDNHRYPTDEQGLEALTEKPAIDPIPRQWQQGGYLKKKAIDPWGNPYVYVVPGEQGAYDIYSLGADGQSGGENFDADIYNREPKQEQ